MENEEQLLLRVKRIQACGSWHDRKGCIELLLIWPYVFLALAVLTDTNFEVHFLVVR